MIAKFKKALGAGRPKGLFYWHKKGTVNFGDQISRDAVEGCLIQRGKSLQSIPDRRLLALGSILHFAEDNDVIWGTGVNFKVAPDKVKARRLDVRAVRGPLTRRFLKERKIECPELYGDPALVLPAVFPRLFERRSLPRESILLIPNLNDSEAYQAIYAQWRGQMEELTILDPRSHWVEVLEAIKEARLVIGSSLHAIVLSELLGVDCRHLVVSTIENIQKYEDYYEGTGRPLQPTYTDFRAALDGTSHAPLAYDPAPLINHFPAEIWT